MTGLLVQMDSNDADLGTCFSIIFLGRTGVGAVFTAVFVAILQNEIPKKLQEYVVPAALDAGLPNSSLTALFTALTAGTTSALEAVPGINSDILMSVSAATAEAYAAAYSYVYYAGVAVGLVGLIGEFSPIGLIRISNYNFTQLAVASRTTIHISPTTSPDKSTMVVKEMLALWYMTNPDRIPPELRKQRPRKKKTARDQQLKNIRAVSKGRNDSNLSCYTH